MSPVSNSSSFQAPLILIYRRHLKTFHVVKCVRCSCPPGRACPQLQTLVWQLVFVHGLHCPNLFCMSCTSNTQRPHCNNMVFWFLTCTAAYFYHIYVYLTSSSVDLSTQSSCIACLLFSYLLWQHLICVSCLKITFALFVIHMCDSVIYFLYICPVFFKIDVLRGRNGLSNCLMFSKNTVEQWPANTGLWPGTSQCRTNAKLVQKWL